MTAQMNFKMSEQMKADIHRLAAEQDLRVGQVFRRAMTAEIVRHDAEGGR